MKWFEPGDEVRYPNGKRIGIVSQTYERISETSERELYKMIIRMECDETHTICGTGINEIVLVKESQRLAKKHKFLNFDPDQYFERKQEDQE